MFIFSDSRVVEGVKQPLKDWHDYDKEKEDLARKGPGEQGRPHVLQPGQEKEKENLYYTNGFNALLSDEIALDRALTDIRHPK